MTHQGLGMKEEGKGLNKKCEIEKEIVVRAG